MGFAITWCAVKEDGADEFLDELGLSATGETEELPESPISMARLDTGWRIIWSNEYDSPFLRPKELAGLSNKREVLLCLVEEHVMASSSEMWSGGKRKWWLSHEGEDGPSGLDLDGELPECFGKVRDEMEKQQAEGGNDADVDYMFEVPLIVAQQLVGFKHDEHCPHLVNNQFAVLSRSTQKRTFISKLLGK